MGVSPVDGGAEKTGETPVFFVGDENLSPVWDPSGPVTVAKHPAKTLQKEARGKHHQRWRSHFFDEAGLFNLRTARRYDWAYLNPCLRPR